MTERTDEKLNFVKIEENVYDELLNELARRQDEIDKLQARLGKLQHEAHQEIKELTEENENLEAQVNRQRRMINGLKINNSALTLERNHLIDDLEKIKSMSMFEFGNKYCSSESLEADGHAFARSLGVGVKMTEAEVEIDKAENAYVPYSGDDF